jgi:integrase
MPLKLVRRPKSPYWYIRGTVRGRAVAESTGTDKREIAETMRSKREWELEQEAVYGKRATSTFLEAAVSYMEGGETRFVERLLAYFGPRPLSSINQTAMDRAAKAMFPNGTPATVNRQLFTPVSAILNHAARRGLCDAPRFQRPKQPKGRIRWLTEDDAERLIDAASPQLRPLIIFLLMTGARLGEALGLDWRDVDLSRAHVSFLDTKNGESRGVPLHDRVIDALTALPHRSGHVFRKPDGKPYPSTATKGGGGQIKTAFAGACKRAGISDLSPHDLRHTWATWHYALNRDMGALMKLGGWKSERMVLRYAHVNTENLKSTIDRMPWRKSGNKVS